MYTTVEIEDMFKNWKMGSGLPNKVPSGEDGDLRGGECMKLQLY
jgi:hypothetical protein